MQNNRGCYEFDIIIQIPIDNGGKVILIDSPCLRVCERTKDGMIKFRGRLFASAE